VSRRDFMPFGEEVAADTNYRVADLKYGVSDSVRQKFTGYQKDDETQLDFAEARMYENRHGRFTAIDPLLASGKSANPQTFNRYTYAVNRPLILNDPTGLQAGKWYQPVDEKGNVVRGNYMYILNGNQTNGYAELTTRNKRGMLIGGGEALDSNHMYRFNPNGPAPFTGGLGLEWAILSDYDYKGYDVIATDAYEESSVEHPADGYARGSEQSITPVDVAATFSGLGRGASAFGSSVARSFATGEGSAVFYTGGGRATAQWANEFAVNTGRQTIEMTRGGRALNTITNFRVGDVSIRNTLPSFNDRIWRFGSRHFAEQASGEVNIFRVSPVRAGSTFNTVEQPILQRSQNVLLRYRRFSISKAQ
jgi:RHS repeat-associated protein